MFAKLTLITAFRPDPRTESETIMTHDDRRAAEEEGGARQGCGKGSTRPQLAQMRRVESAPR